MRNSYGGATERRQYPRTNQMLAARVCVELDEKIRHSKAIQVFAEGNHVTLRGIALADEIEEVLTTASKVKGVFVVSNQLEALDSPARVLALQA